MVREGGDPMSHPVAAPPPRRSSRRLLTRPRRRRSRDSGPRHRQAGGRRCGGHPGPPEPTADHRHGSSTAVRPGQRARAVPLLPVRRPGGRRHRAAAARPGDPVGSAPRRRPRHERLPRGRGRGPRQARRLRRGDRVGPRGDRRGCGGPARRPDALQALARHGEPVRELRRGSPGLQPSGIPGRRGVPERRERLRSGPMRSRFWRTWSRPTPSGPRTRWPASTLCGCS